MEHVTITRTYDSTTFFLSRIINGILGLVGAALVLRLALELLHANPASPFIAFVYFYTDQLLYPFIGAFLWLSIGTDTAIWLTILIALIGYALIGWFLNMIVASLFGTEAM